jgi:parallel beta-helix repeat protein
VFSVGVIVVVGGPPSSGDWIVTGTESYSDQTIVLDGNLIVENGGNLTFEKVTFELKCHFDGEYSISVNPGGKFYVLDGSVITSYTPSNAYSFLVQPNSTFRMSNSELHSSGWHAVIPTPEQPMGLSIFSDDAVVENCLISNNEYSILAMSGGIVIRNNNITENEQGINIGGEGINPSIYDNYMSKNGVGINLGGGCSPYIYDNAIEFSGTGINVAGATPVIRRNSIIKNRDGIVFYSRANPMILDNTIASNNNTGINVRDSNGTIQGNMIENNPIIISEESNPTLRANYIASSGGRGVFFTGGSSGLVEGNIITNHTLGIHLGDSSPIIRGNIITANYNGIQCQDDSKPEIHWNDIYNNSGRGVNNEDPSTLVNATHNYWGSANGPGQGVSQHVLYSPWLNESIVPNVEITSPLSGEDVSATLKVSTNVRSRNTVQKVEFYLDGFVDPKYTDYDSPYEWNWDTTQCAETPHTIWVVAYDNYGLRTKLNTTVFVDNTSPVASIREPQPGNIYCGTVAITVNGTDNREVNDVRFKVDDGSWGIMTYNQAVSLWKGDLNTTTFSDGQHNLMVLALDKAGNPATTTMTLTTDNTLPTLTIQHPQSGVTVGLTLTVMVQANDTSGISKVEFYLANTLVSTLTTVPYQWAWDTTKYPNGAYTIIVEAYDTIGNVKSRDVKVTVNNVEVPWLQANLLTIVQVAIGLGGLTIAIVTFWSRTRDKRKKKTTRKKETTTNLPSQENSGQEKVD